MYEEMLTTTYPNPISDFFTRLFANDFTTVIVLALLLGVPAWLAIMAVVNLFRKNPRAGMLTDGLSMILGTVYLLLLLGLLDYRQEYWTQLVYFNTDMGGELHTPFAGAHLPTLLVFCAVGLVAYLVLRYRARCWPVKPERYFARRYGQELAQRMLGESQVKGRGAFFYQLKLKRTLPPLVAALCLAGVCLGMFTAVLVIIQFSSMPNLLIMLLLSLFPAVYLLCAARLLRTEAKAQAARIGGQNPYAEKHRVLRFAGSLMCKVSGWYLLPFLLVVPLAALLIVLLLLFGQRADAFIRVFLDTSDWRLSQQISPPSVVLDGHYLCTVALRGHKKLVRPLRYGRRCGRRIVVNRQLCVANAFEEALAERHPGLHKKLRSFYNRRGYPLSKIITTAWRADFTYLLMKPLEWLFLLYLYTVQPNPENRIALQYTRR